MATNFDPAQFAQMLQAMTSGKGVGSYGTSTPGLVQNAVQGVQAGPFGPIASNVAAPAATQSFAQTAAAAAPQAAAALPTTAAQGLSTPVYPFAPATVGMNAAPAAGAASKLFPALRGGMPAGAGRFAAGSLGRGSLYGTAGIVGGSIINKANIGGEGSDADQMLTGAATGAGIGAGIGSIIFPGVGTAVGAGIGGIGGALIGKFGPKKSAAKEAAKIDKAAASALAELDAATIDLPVDARTALRDQFINTIAAQKAMAAAGKDPIKQLAAQLIAQKPQIEAAEKARVQQQQLETQRAGSQQAAIGMFMRPYLQNLTDTGESAARQYEQLGKPELAASARQNSARLVAAYGAQTQAFPAMFAIQNQLGYQRQVNQQLQAQQIAQATGAGGGSGISSLEDIAAGG